MDDKLLKLVQEEYPDIDESFVKRNLLKATTKQQLETLAHKLNLPLTTFTFEKNLHSIHDIADKKLVILTHQYGTGSSDGHWITIFPDSTCDNTFFFFDSYGQSFKNKYFDIYYFFPEEYKIEDFNPNMDFQSDDSDICGWYCIAVLYCWYILSNKKLWEILKLKPINKTDLFDKDKELKRHYNDILVTFFIDFISNNDKNQVINYFKI